MPTLSYAADESIPSGPYATTSAGRSTETPVIAGTVTGGVIGIAWVIMFVMWFIKRWKRLHRAKRAGLKTHRLLPDEVPKPEPYIIPPDPAIIQGSHVPGEKVFPDRAAEDYGQLRRSKTTPLTRGEKDEQREPSSGSETPAMPHHPASAPDAVMASTGRATAQTHDLPEKLPLSPSDLERGGRPPFDQ